MKKIFFAIAVLLTINTMAQETNGLLIIAHGSSSTTWNSQVLTIKSHIKGLLITRNIQGYSEVEIAFMEAAKPSIADAIRKFEKMKITRIYVLPLLIAPSGHSMFDIPTLLGLYYEKDLTEILKEEKSEIVNTKINMTVGPTLQYSNIMKDILLDKVKTLSTNPKEEALIILAHGDENFMPVWEELVNKTGDYILAKTGIEYFDKAFVEVGQSFAVEGVNTILKASEEKKKVIVVGMYIAMGVKQMAENSGFVMRGRTFDTKTLFEGKNIVFAETGLLPDPRIEDWLVDRAEEWLER